jgi:hypothetical protein
MLRTALKKGSAQRLVRLTCGSALPFLDMLIEIMM